MSNRHTKTATDSWYGFQVLFAQFLVIISDDNKLAYIDDFLLQKH